MTAKYYLSELSEMREGIQLEKELRQEYLDMATSIAAPIKEIRVQTSRSDNGKVERYGTLVADIDMKIERDEQKYYQHQFLIVNQIRALHNVYYIQVLFKVYVKFRNIKQVADEMKMSYPYVRDLHKKALAEFGKVHADVIADWKKGR